MLTATNFNNDLKKNLFLVSLRDISDAAQYVTPAQFNALNKIQCWIHQYLMCPHAMLGRTGAVCPYVAKAVRENCIFLTVINQDIFEKKHFYEIILNYFDWFNQTQVQFGNKHIYRSIIMLIDISNEDNHRIIEQAVDDLKSHFVRKKSMLGEFHSGPPQKSGIRNSAFKPLASPVPLLAIREMVETDIEFLKDNPADLAHYHQFFQRKKTNDLSLFS